MTSTSDTALIVIDVQLDFCPGGALAVPMGDQVVAPINLLMEQVGTVVLTQDWHPLGHSSFASSHEGRAPFDTAEMFYGTQVLWPDHCVQNTNGADFHPGLRQDADLILRKGFRPEIDSYSAFFENDQTTVTGLHGYLQERGIAKLVLAGLATDFCVAFSAMDAVRLGYDVSIVPEACRAIDLDGSLETQMENMRKRGVKFL